MVHDYTPNYKDIFHSVEGLPKLRELFSTCKGLTQGATIVGTFRLGRFPYEMEAYYDHAETINEKEQIAFAESHINTPEGQRYFDVHLRFYCRPRGENGEPIYERTMGLWRKELLPALCDKETFARFLAREIPRHTFYFVKSKEEEPAEEAFRRAVCAV